MCMIYILLHYKGSEQLTQTEGEPPPSYAISYLVVEDATSHHSFSGQSFFSPLQLLFVSPLQPQGI